MLRVSATSSLLAPAALEQQQLFIIYHALRRDSFCGGSA